MEGFWFIEAGSNLIIIFWLNPEETKNKKLLVPFVFRNKERPIISSVFKSDTSRSNWFVQETVAVLVPKSILLISLIKLALSILSLNVSVQHPSTGVASLHSGWKCVIGLSVGFHTPPSSHRPVKVCRFCTQSTRPEVFPLLLFAALFFYSRCLTCQKWETSFVKLNPSPCRRYTINRPAAHPLKIKWPKRREEEVQLLF